MSEQIELDKAGKTADERRETYAEMAGGAHPDSYTGTSPINVNKLGHLVYEVSDIDRTVRFWTEVMGFKVSEGNEKGMVFLNCGGDHHAIGLKPAKGKTRRPPTDAGLNVEHLAMEVDSPEILLKARDFLKANNIPIVFEGRKGAGCNIAINFLDPDGYEFEIYCWMDQIKESGRLRPSEQFRKADTLDEAIAHPVPKDW